MPPTIAALPAAGPVGTAGTPCLPTAASVAVAPTASAERAPIPVGAAVTLTTAPFLGFGQVRYAESAASAPVLIAAGVRTPLTFTLDPTQTQAFLNPPFAGALAFDGTTITPRALDDSMFVLVNLLVTSAVAGGAIKVDVDVGSPAGPTGAATQALFNAAGAAERVTCTLYVQTLAYFMANGARLFITATVPISLVNQAVVLIPQSTHPTM